MNSIFLRQKITATVRLSKLKDLKTLSKSYAVIGIDEGQFVSKKNKLLYLF